MGWLDWLTRRRDAPALTAPAIRRTDAATITQNADAVVNPFTGLGDPTRDKGQAARPAPRRRLTVDELTSAHTHHGIVRRGIALKAADATRGGWSVSVEGEVDDPLGQLWQDLGVVPTLKSALTWARVYGGCVILMVTDDAPDRASLARPLTEGAQVRRLVVVDRLEATAATWEMDPTQPGFRRPSSWVITPAGSSIVGGMVHASRVLYIPGDPLPPSDWQHHDGYDQSVIESAWDATRDYLQVSAGAAVLTQEMKQAVMQIAGLTDSLLDSDGPALVKAKMAILNQSRALTGTMILDEDDVYHHHDQTVAGFGDLAAASRVAVANAWGYPQALFFGDAPSGLNTDGASGRSNYREDVADIQADKIEPVLRRLAEVSFAGLGEVPAEWGIEFASLDEPGAKESAEVQLLHAQADEIRIRSQVLTPDHVARSRFTARGYGEDIDPVTLPDTPDDAGSFEDAEALRLIVGGDPDAPDGAQGAQGDVDADG